MSAVSSGSDVGIAGRERDEFGNEKTHGRTFQALGRVLFAIVIVVSVIVGLRGTMFIKLPSLSGSGEPTSASVPVMPAAPTDGVLTIVVPPGAAANQQTGGRGSHMPNVIQLTAGDTHRSSQRRHRAAHDPLRVSDAR